MIGQDSFRPFGYFIQIKSVDMSVPCVESASDNVVVEELSGNGGFLCANVALSGEGGPRGECVSEGGNQLIGTAESETAFNVVVELPSEEATERERERDKGGIDECNTHTQHNTDRETRSLRRAA